MPRQSFKVGDKVRCIDNGGKSTIQNGAVYTIARVSPGAGTVNLAESKSAAIDYYDWRFEPYTEERPLIEQALQAAIRAEDAKPAKKPYVPETFVGRDIDFTQITRDLSSK